MEIIGTCTVFGVFILLSYTMGLRNGQRISKDKEIEMPKSPVKAIEEYKESREEKKAQKELEEVLEKINNYSGE